MNVARFRIALMVIGAYMAGWLVSLAVNSGANH